MSEYDVAKVRAHFPALESGLAFFDGPGGSQTPDVVGEAVRSTLVGPLSNRGDLTVAQDNAERAVVEAREALGDLLGAAPDGVVFGRSFTQLTFDVSRAMAKEWGPDHEVVVTRLDHDGNVRPWVLAARAVGATVRWVDFDPETGELSLESLEDALSSRTRLVAVTGASNLIGTRPDLPAIAERVHGAGGWLYVDAVHLTPHASVSLEQSGADFLGCSAYKFLGPHVGVLAGRVELLERLHPDKLVPASDRVPERFELGTLPYEMLAGVTAAIDLVADLAPEGSSRRERLVLAHALIQDHELRLRARLEEGLAALGERVTLHSRAADRTSTLFITFRDHEATAVAEGLVERDVLAPAGTFYAQETFRALKLSVDAGLRIGLAAYNDDAEVDRLLEGLTDLVI